MKKYLKLYSCCIPVKGASLSIICDLQRNSFHYIPNELYDVLQKGEIELKSFYKGYKKEDQETLQEYFKFLLDEEYAMLTDNPELFPEIDSTYISPELINNAIIDFAEDSNHDVQKILISLEELGCKHLELRFYSTVSIDFICNKILHYLEDTRLRSVMLYIKYTDEFTKENIHDRITRRYPIVLNVLIHSAPYNRNDENIKFRNIIYIDKEIPSEKQCGCIGLEYFTINYSSFFESLSFNSCLHKKLGIDSKGYIKNCPSMDQNYGHHKHIHLRDVVLKEKFHKIGRINKDQIDTCKDCQFRYICSDCRAYVQNSSDILSKPLKCGYDPYKNEWKSWSQHEFADIPTG